MCFRRPAGYLQPPSGQPLRSRFPERGADVWYWALYVCKAYESPGGILQRVLGVVRALCARAIFGAHNARPVACALRGAFAHPLQKGMNGV